MFSHDIDKYTVTESTNYAQDDLHLHVALLETRHLCGSAELYAQLVRLFTTRVLATDSLRTYEGTPVTHVNFCLFACACTPYR
jgi:UTP:GlnB (protein PII) uridylyltransferase